MSDLEKQIAAATKMNLSNASWLAEDVPSAKRGVRVPQGSVRDLAAAVGKSTKQIRRYFKRDRNLIPGASLTRGGHLRVPPNTAELVAEVRRNIAAFERAPKRSKIEKEQDAAQSEADALATICEVPLPSEMIRLESKERKHLRAQTKEWERLKAEARELTEKEKDAAFIRKMIEPDWEAPAQGIGPRPTWHKFNEKTLKSLKPLERDVVLVLHGLIWESFREGGKRRRGITRQDVAERLNISRSALHRGISPKRWRDLRRAVIDELAAERFEKLFRRRKRNRKTPQRSKMAQ